MPPGQRSSSHTSVSPVGGPHHQAAPIVAVVSHFAQTKAGNGGNMRFLFELPILQGAGKSSPATASDSQDKRAGRPLRSALGVSNSPDVRPPRQIVGPDINHDGGQTKHDTDPEHRRMMDSPPVALFSSWRISILICLVHRSIRPCRKRLISISRLTPIKRWSESAGSTVVKGQN
jgi:hypothetical protein